MEENKSAILVLDDDVSMRQLLAAMLDGSGHNVIQASDGNAAIDYSRRHAVSLLITDLVMPDQEGIEIIRRFVQEFPTIPILAMSAKSDYLPAAQALGARGVLKKPFTSADLQQAIRKITG